MGFQWIKLHAETVLEDPHFGRLPLDVQMIYVKLYALAGKYQRGEPRTGIIPLGLDEIAWYLRLPVEMLQAAVERLVQTEMVGATSDGHLQLTRYAEEQKMLQRDAAADRKRRQRQRRKDDAAPPPLPAPSGGQPAKQGAAAAQKGHGDVAGMPQCGHTDVPPAPRHGREDVTGRSPSVSQCGHTDVTPTSQDSHRDVTPLKNQNQNQNPETDIKSSSPSSPEEGGPGGGTVSGGGEGGGGIGQTAPETHPAQGAGVPRAPVRPQNSGQASRKAAPMGPNAAGKPQSLAEGPPRAPAPLPGGGKKTSSPRKRRKKHPPPEDPRVALLHAAGITNGKVPKILARGAALEDILAELARCYDPASGVRRPELIAPRHLLAGESPPATYRQPQVWQKHLPDTVLQAAGLEPWRERRLEEAQGVWHGRYEPVDADAGPPPFEPQAPPEVRTAWKRLMDELEADMPRAEFETWVRSVRLLAYREGDGTVVLGARNAYARDWLSDRLSIIVQRGLTGMLDRDIRVQFEVV